MDTVVREYRPEDRDGLVNCMRGLQGFIAAIDPLERQRGAADFDADAYTDVILKGVQSRNGMIFISEFESRIVGCVAGWLVQEDDADLIAAHPSKTGRVFELFVDEVVRGRRVGSRLMEHIEAWFREQGCDSVRVEVFYPNENAADFYKKNGYTERCLDLLKIL